MRLMAYIDLSFFADQIRSMPTDETSTITKLRNGLDKCSKIPGLVEMHFVYGRDKDAYNAIAKVEVEEVQDITNVINEIKKTFPLKGCTTLIVWPQILPGEKAKNPNFS